MTRAASCAVPVLTMTLLLASACEKRSSGPVTGPASPQEERVRAIVAEQFNKKPEYLDVVRTLDSQGIAIDDLDMVELVMEVEDALGVTISDETLVAALGGGPGDPRKLSIRILADAAAKSPPTTRPETPGPPPAPAAG